MTNRHDNGGLKTRTPRSHSFRYGQHDGEDVVLVALPDGREVVVSRKAWHTFIELGYSPKLTMDRSDCRNAYVRSMAHYPGGLRAVASTTARTLLAIAMVGEERAGGIPASAKGWVARTKNGNPLDLRDSNLCQSKASGHRNSYRAIWDVRKRWGLVDKGLSPNGVYEEERRAARELSNSGTFPAQNDAPIDEEAWPAHSPRTAPYAPTQSISLATGGTV